ncbi:putative B3 domain-containing protein Os08g0325100 [Triticum aestivum]|uniref:putative B3 domain-containing protein Os08g0325100 n=1 Tax=Triticum aestivum TaxID=4565 RepID=UPI001D0256E7|nr:putative B3 domain-containing protein Os08g0325100 [Triticum aestivum]
MIIPEEFVRRFKGEFPREMILETKNRCSYIIGVAKNKEKLVLTVGWGKFVETFGLEMGDTIVFRYNGNSQFSVIIFDKLGCEKALSVVPDLFPPPVQERCTNATDTVKSSQPIQMQPFGRVNGLPVESPPTKRQRHFQMEVDESCQGKITAINISSAEPSGESFLSEDSHGACDVPDSNYFLRKKKANLSSFLCEEESFSSEDGYGVRDACVKKKKATLSSSQKEQLKDGYITMHKAKLSPAQKEVVKQKVQSIHSEIPIFVAVMGKMNLDSRFVLTLPSQYAKKYLGEEPRLYLQLLGDKWEVGFPDNTGDRRIVSGWKQFAQDNNLKMGDICLFELLSNQKRTMEVYIIPATDYNYSAGVQNDVDQEALEGGSAPLQREALAHHADGARDPDSRLLRITNTDAWKMMLPLLVPDSPKEKPVVSEPSIPAVFALWGKQAFPSITRARLRRKLKLFCYLRSRSRLVMHADWNSPSCSFSCFNPGSIM